MKNKLLIAALFLTTNILYSQNYSLDQILNKKFQISLISRGDNIPDFGVKKDSLHFFLVSLHNEIPVKEFQHRVQFSDEKMEEIVTLLITKNWAHKMNGVLKPSVFIATEKDGENLYKFAEPISTQISKEIKKQIKTIKKEFNKTDISKTQSFDEWSFLILSNVLLDNWQIFNVENEFLGTSARPLRHGKNYYASITELTGEREGFNIYGNQFGEISVYGNNRRFANLRKTDYFVNKKDNEIFGEMAKDFLPKLIKILNKHKAYSREVYQKLAYANEITFEEFYMMWYHFIYTQATDKMEVDKLLIIPKDGNFVYGLEM